MTSYDPRTHTGIPTEPVGSLPRPAKLQATYAAYDAGKIAFAELEAKQDEAVRDSITRFEATGSPIISDGEQRISSFATRPVIPNTTNQCRGEIFFARIANHHHRIPVHKQTYSWGT